MKRREIVTGILSTAAICGTRSTLISNWFLLPEGKPYKTLCIETKHISFNSNEKYKIYIKSKEIILAMQQYFKIADCYNNIENFKDC